MADKSQVSGVEIIVHRYDMVQTGVQTNRFTLNTTYHVFPLSKVISVVNVVFNVQSGEYEIQPDEASLLESVVNESMASSQRGSQSRSQHRRSTEQSRRRYQNISDEGRMVQGSSRSGRVSNMVVYEFSYQKSQLNKSLC